MGKLLDYLKVHMLVSYLLVLIVSSVAGTGVYFMAKPILLPKAKVKPLTSAALLQEKKTILGAATSQVKLPENEEPIIATVSDKDKLQSQIFFKKALNGDKLLMYPQHKKIYLYRPSLKRVISVSALDYAYPSAKPPGKPTPNSQ